MLSTLTKENISNHFIINPVWEELFLKHYPNWKPDSYLNDAVELFKKNGYTITNKRMSERKTSKFYHVVEAELQKDGEFIFSFQTHDDLAIKQIIIDCVCNYEIDFSTFK